jgi:tetratricopeptide (TPR) repeat protein
MSLFILNPIILVIIEQMKIYILFLILPFLIFGEEESISDFQARWELAKIYSHKKENYQKALFQYLMLIKEKPDNIDLNMDLAHLYFNLKEEKKGLNLLYKLLEKYPNHPKLLVALAQGEVLSGHFLKAKNLMLKTNHPLDFANLMVAWGDFYKAEKIVLAMLEKEDSIDLKLKLASIWRAEERLSDADLLYQDLLVKYPNNKKVLKNLAELKFEEKDFEKVLCYLEAIPEDEEVLLLKAKTLSFLYNYEEPLSIYQALSKPLEMGKIYLKLDDREAALNSFQEAFNQIECPWEAKDLLEWGNLYFDLGFYEKAYLFYAKALEEDPEFFPATIKLAETLAMLYNYQQALDIYQNLLDQFPENAKILKAMARVLAWSKNYHDAYLFFDTLICLNQEDYTLYREKARAAFWGDDYDISFSTYDELLTDPFNYLVQTATFYEKKGKVLTWQKRYIPSLCAYEKLLEIEPGNEEGLYDYAQNFCIIGLCDEAEKVYERILNFDSNHTLVEMAFDRNQIKRHVGIQNSLSYWREVGTGSFSQSQIARYKFDTEIEWPLSCRSHLRFIQHEYVENPFYNFKFYPAVGETIAGDYQWNENLKANVSATYKTYFGNFKPTITSHNQLVYLNDNYYWIFGLNKSDEIYNYFSLNQKIQALDSWVTGTSHVTPYWDFSLSYHHYQYNDSNDQNYINLTSEHQLTDDPKVFKLILQGNYRNTKHQTLSIFEGSTLVNMIHPYWTPHQYFSGSMTLEFRRDFRTFEYCEGPERYLDLKFSGEMDNVNNPGVEIVVEWKHEFYRHFGIDVKGLLHRSRQWNAEGFWGTLFYRY